jgi:hypothetical protein
MSSSEVLQTTSDNRSSDMEPEMEGAARKTELLVDLNVFWSKATYITDFN